MYIYIISVGVVEKKNCVESSSANNMMTKTAQGKMFIRLIFLYHSMNDTYLGTLGKYKIALCTSYYGVCEHNKFIIARQIGNMKW